MKVEIVFLKVSRAQDDILETTSIVQPILQNQNRGLIQGYTIKQLLDDIKMVFNEDD